MTDTIDMTAAETEASITPGTLCWVMTGEDAPSTVRHQRVMAIYTQGIGSNRWLLLVPNGENPQHGTHGWVLRSNLTNSEMDRMGATRFRDTHRGWWMGNRARFIETCIGHWCVTHQAFHATVTCPPEMVAPPSDEPSRFAHTARIAELERQLAEAKAANEALVKDHEEFKIRASDLLAAEADSHDLCGEYDRIAEEAGLYRRRADYEVTFEVTYRQTVTVNAHSESAAEDTVRDAAVISGWHPDLVLNLDVQDTCTPTDVTTKVIVEPPF